MTYFGYVYNEDRHGQVNVPLVRSHLQRGFTTAPVALALELPNCKGAERANKPSSPCGQRALSYLNNDWIKLRIGFETAKKLFERQG
jgi:hypothetical protein